MNVSGTPIEGDCDGVGVPDGDAELDRDRVDDSDNDAVMETDVVLEGDSDGDSGVTELDRLRVRDKVELAVAGPVWDADGVAVAVIVPVLLDVDRLLSDGETVSLVELLHDAVPVTVRVRESVPVGFATWLALAIHDRVGDAETAADIGTDSL